MNLNKQTYHVLVQSFGFSSQFGNFVGVISEIVHSTGDRKVHETVVEVPFFGCVLILKYSYIFNDLKMYRKNFFEIESQRCFFVFQWCKLLICLPFLLLLVGLSLLQLCQVLAQLVGSRSVCGENLKVNVKCISSAYLFLALHLAQKSHHFFGVAHLDWIVDEIAIGKEMENKLEGRGKFESKLSRKFAVGLILSLIDSFLLEDN